MRARARKIKTKNSYKPWDANSLYYIYKSTDDISEIAEQLGRSLHAIKGMRSVEKRALEHNSVDAVKNDISSLGYSKDTVDGLVELYRMVKLGDHRTTNFVDEYPAEYQSEEKVAISNDQMNQLLEKLDNSFEDLKQVMIEVIAVGIEKKIEEFKKEKDVEIASLKAVVDAAKSSNLVDTLKKKLMGY